MCDIDWQASEQNHNHAKDGLPMQCKDTVDLTLIRWMLSLTPCDRLQTLQQWIQIVKVREDDTEGDSNQSVLPIFVRVPGSKRNTSPT